MEFLREGVADEVAEEGVDEGEDEDVIGWPYDSEESSSYLCGAASKQSRQGHMGMRLMAGGGVQ